MSELHLVLASRSPRRLELLRAIGLEPRVVPARVDEAVRSGEGPRELVLRLAETKGRRVAGSLSGGLAPAVVLAADTAVVLDGNALGKPRDAAEAAGMLGRLRGRAHDVLTAVFLLRTDDGRCTSGVATTRVRFRRFTDATLRGYVAGSEPMDKAGAYGIQGAGSRLVESVQGSWSNVVGLPLELLPRWMLRIGVELDALARQGGRE